MKKNLPVACSLSGAELSERRERLAREVFSGILSEEELADGYEFAFPGSGHWARRLTEIVVAERDCCQFFVFELVFEPGGGRIRLRVRGPEGTKEFVRGELLAPAKTSQGGPAGD